jgi:hypothetical protein
MRAPFVEHLGSPWQASYSEFYGNILPQPQPVTH